MSDAMQGLVVLVVCVLLCVGLAIGGVAGCGAYKNFNRGQRLKDASNAVKITHINIQKANQQAEITRAEIAATKAEADKRYWEATGIKRAQDEISKTLTPLYVQHEAIKALQGASSTVYIPSGAQGIPQVYDVGKSVATK